MFRGRNELAIDDKGRVMLPIKFREALAKKDEAALILTNLDDCLIAYTTTAWSEIEKNILSRPDRTTAERNFKRFLIGGVQECSIDKQGRILVPQSLRQYAGLDKDVVIVGLIDHFEIWSLDGHTKAIQQGQQSQETDEIRALRHDVRL